MTKDTPASSLIPHKTIGEVYGKLIVLDSNGKDIVDTTEGQRMAKLYLRALQAVMK